MITTKKVSILKDSLIYKFPSDYSDSFECNFASSKEIKADDVQIAFWSAKPIWINWLFKLRNLLVKPFKLDSNVDSHSEDLKNAIRTGKPHAGISIPAKSENETVLQVDDKHLTFYVSVQIKDKDKNSRCIIVSTLVCYHNTMGKCYFAIICPFHKIIVRNILKYVVKKHYSE
ncbi:MAG: DUF2867 domain-containing protein [Bacteroidales bacterium]|nr:DUF2867 domain-containing protein [Bacteroidales bacterium]